jgi:cell division protease FtsH
MKKKNYEILRIIGAIFTFILLISLVYYFANLNQNVEQYKKTNLSSFLISVKNKTVKKISFVEYEKIEYSTTSSEKLYTYLPKNLQKKVIFLLSENHADIQYISQQKPIKRNKLMDIIFDILTVVALLFLFRLTMNNGMMNMSKMNKDENGEISTVKFSDVAGIDTFKNEVEEVVDFLKNPEKYRSKGVKMPKGILLVGPPGTGKTLIAKAVAGEANVAFFPTTGSDFVEMYVGLGASRMRALFEKARKSAPAVIFIDEIDAIGQKRNQNLGSQEHSNTLVALLSLMDGFYSSNIIVIAATNIVKVLDPALLRPGRFDRIIHVPLPDIKGREEILKLVLSKIKIPYELNIEDIARKTIQFSGAQLTNLINEALFLTVRNNRDKLTHLEINEALSKILFGIGRPGRYNMEDKILVAYHEAGHCIMSHLYKDIVWPIFKLTIVTHGDALGFLANLPNNDSIFQSKEYLEAQLQICLGGRAAEEVFIGGDKITNGASSDLEQATSICTSMLSYYGMTSHNLYQINERNHYNQFSIMSEKMKEMIYDETNKIMKSYYEKTLEIIKAHEKTIHTLVFFLMRYETLYKEDIENIINGHIEIVGENPSIQINVDFLSPFETGLLKI